MGWPPALITVTPISGTPARRVTSAPTPGRSNQPGVDLAARALGDRSVSLQLLEEFPELQLAKEGNECLSVSGADPEPLPVGLQGDPAVEGHEFAESLA